MPIEFRARGEYGTGTTLLWEATTTQVLVDRTIDLIADAGYTWILDYVRPGVDLRAGRVQWWIDAVQRRGLEPIVRIDGSYSDIPRWAKFAGEAAQRFKDCCKYFQLGNEPEFAGVGCDQYGQAADEVARAIRSAHPTAEVWANFATLRSFEDAGYACSYAGEAIRSQAVDRVSVHIYHQSGLPELACDGRPGTYDQQVRCAMDVIGGPFPITESGHSRAWSPGSAAARERSQARREIRMMVQAAIHGTLPRIGYTFISRTTSDTNQETAFGIMRDLDTPCLGYWAVKRFCQLFTGAEYVGPETVAGVDYAYRFTLKDGRSAVVLWNGTDESVIPWIGGGWAVNFVDRTTVQAGSTIKVGAGPVAVIR